MTTFSTVQSIQDAWGLRKGALVESRRQTVERRERAVHSALVHGIPNTRDEEWKYTSLRPLLDRKFDLIEVLQHVVAPVDGDVVEVINRRLVPGAIPIVFVNGSLDLSWAGSEDLDPDFSKR